MLEKYYDRARALPNNNTRVITLDGQDMADWKSLYYPQLVQSSIIQDGTFFQNPLINKNYGIGADGQFTKYEYVQFLWKAYKYVVTDFSANFGVKYIKECIDMLEPYADAFMNHGTETSDVHPFREADMTKWKYEYYPYFSKSGIVPDGQFFGDVQTVPNYGIGLDGCFAGEELCHFLYQLYKFANIVINRNIPTWRVLFLLCKNTQFNGENVYLSDEDCKDMENAINRFQKFVFAYSRGYAAVEVETRIPDYPVPLHQDNPDNYYIDIGDLPYDDGWKYIVDNSADAAIYYARYGKFGTQWLGLSALGSCRFGQEERKFGYINLRGLKDVTNDKYLKPSPECPFPEEVAVHEFCHLLQFVLQDLFCLGTLVNPDEASKYGYKNETPNAPIGGFYSFYQDILAGKVKDASGAEIGVKPDMWSHTMRSYNDKSRTNTLSAKAVLSAEEIPVITDLKIRTIQ